jgi:hypothetical protein
LVADRRRHAAQERRNLRPRLREAEDVVDEQQNVLAFSIAEILGHRQRRQPDAEAGAWRLRHLSVHERGSRLAGIIDVDDPALLKLEPQIVTLARPFTNTAEHRHATVFQRDVVDELHDDDGLADTGATKEPDLAALQVRLEQVDDLDPGFEHLQLGRLVFEVRSLAVDRPVLLRHDGPVRKVHGLPEHVQHAPECSGTHRHLNRVSKIGRLHPALHPIGRLHRNGANAVLAQVLLDFCDDVEGCRSALAIGDDSERTVDLRKVSGLELDVDNWPDHLNDVSDILCHMCSQLERFRA